LRRRNFRKTERDGETWSQGPQKSGNIKGKGRYNFNNTLIVKAGLI
jgi:hypothetical protein